MSTVLGDWVSTIATTIGLPDPISHGHHGHDSKPEPEEDDTSDD